MGLLLLIAAVLFQSTISEETRAGVILQSTDRYLLVQSRFTGKWSFTKGHAESHDINLLETATREVKEETGFLETLHYTIDSGPYEIGRSTYWMGTIKGNHTPTLKQDEHTGMGLFTKKEIRALKTNKDIRSWLKTEKIEITPII
jgi:8-oxo-dGTP pyrophosphatase MutT (NUDIX family)